MTALGYDDQAPIAADPDGVGRRCAQLQRLALPGVARIVEAEATDGQVHTHEQLPDGATAVPATLPEEQALRVVGELAMALAGLHARGLRHGRVGLERLRLDRDGSPVLAGLARAAADPVAASDDVAALGVVLRVLVPSPTARSAGVRDLLATRPLPEAAEVGRTALAAATPEPTAPADADLPAEDPSGQVAVPVSIAAGREPRDPDRIRVRNRLIGVGVVVVLVGLGLLEVLGNGGSHLTVPATAGRTEANAVSVLRAVGLRTREVEVASGSPAGAVVGTVPAAGSRVKAGSTVTLQVSSGSAS